MGTYRDCRHRAATLVLDTEADSCAVIGFLNHYENGRTGIPEERNPDGATLLFPVGRSQHTIDKFNQCLSLLVEVHHRAETALAAV